MNHTVTISHEMDLNLLIAALRRSRNRATVWLRVGAHAGDSLAPDDVWPLAVHIQSEPALELSGVFSIAPLSGSKKQAHLLDRLAAYCADRAVVLPRVALIITD